MYYQGRVLPVEERKILNPETRGDGAVLYSESYLDGTQGIGGNQPSESNMAMRREGWQRGG